MPASSDPALEPCLGPLVILLLLLHVKGREGKSRESVYRVVLESTSDMTGLVPNFCQSQQNCVTYLLLPFLYSITKQKVSANQPPPLLHNDTQVQM